MDTHLHTVVGETVCRYGGSIETKVQGMATHLHTGVG